MLALGSLALRPARGSADAPAGPAMVTLTAVAVRMALTIRCLALASSVAYWAGAVLSTATGSAGNSPAAAGAFLLTVAAASWRGLRMIYRRATAADGALAQADTDARAQYVALLRNTERREHERLLHDTVLNMLTALARPASSAVDGGAGVHERCARYAASLRRALTDRTRDAGGLLSELEAALSSAAGRGLPTEIRVVGDPGRPTREVAGATLAAVDGVMRALPPHAVTLTVLASSDEVELYVIFDQRPQAGPDMTELTQGVSAAAEWSATVDVDDSGAGRLEVRWRKLAAA